MSIAATTPGKSGPKTAYVLAGGGSLGAVQVGIAPNHTVKFADVRES